MKVTDETPELRHRHYLEQEFYALVTRDTLMFEFIQEAALDGIWYWDLEAPEHEWMSPKFWRLFGYEPERMQHKVSEWQSLIFPEDLETAQRNLALHLKDPSIPYDQIVRYWHKDGSVVWVRCRGVAICNAEGNAIRLLGAHTDITPIMQKQQELIGVKFRLDESQRLVQKLEGEKAVLKAQNDSLNQRLLASSLTENSGLLTMRGFLDKCLFMQSLAQRTQLNVNALRVAHKVPEAAENLGVEQQSELDAGICRTVSQHMPDALVVRLSDELIGVITSGYTVKAFSELGLHIEEALNSTGFLTVKPVFHVTCRTLPAQQANTQDIEALLAAYF